MTDTMAGEAQQWRENVTYMLEDGDPDVIRCHEGGGPEDLIMSLVLTMMRTRKKRDEALAAQPSAGAQEIVWVRSGADVNGDPLTLKTTFGDMDVNVVKSRGTGLWNVSGYILGKMGIATEAEAVAYAEDRLRSDADRRVRAAHKAISLYATPAQPDTGCCTEADGSCTSPGPCMHTPVQPETGAEALREIEADIRKLCNGHPHARIEWPHRDLHTIADRLAALSTANTQGAK